MRATGPAAVNSSSPTLATPNHGCSSRASLQGLDDVVDVEGQGQVVTGVGHGSSVS